jgi:hypothetical protein
VDGLEEKISFAIKKTSKQHFLIAKTNCKLRFYFTIQKDLQVE